MTIEKKAFDSFKESLRDFKYTARDTVISQSILIDDFFCLFSLHVSKNNVYTLKLNIKTPSVGFGLDDYTPTDFQEKFVSEINLKIIEDYIDACYLELERDLL